jgi:hypothetical protein
MNADVMATVHDRDGYRAVKIIKRPDGTFGFQEYRRDPEDAGGWTFVAQNSRGPFRTQEEALAAAKSDIGWLRQTSSADGAR